MGAGMPARRAQHCPERSGVEALIREVLNGAQELPPEARRRIHRHLEHCGPCRTLYREETASRFPRVRNYTIVECVGEGGFGAVYRAIHYAKERTEALKMLTRRTGRLIEYFQNEVHLIARLRHPNIATLYDANLSSPPLYYTMEFIEGQRFDEYCRRQRLPLEQRLRIMRDVATAVHYAHENGVVHRDLKPQNILIDAGGTPHIVDFGISLPLGEAQNYDPDRDQVDPGAAPRREGAVGTLGYMAPEQIAGGRVDGRADIYALGVLLWQTVTGDPARLAGQSERLLAALREREVARAEDLAAIISRCLVRNPDERYRTCAELAADLDNYLAGRPIRAREVVSLPYRLVRYLAYVVRYHPQAVRAAIVLAMATLLCGLLWGREARRLVPGGGTHQTVLIALSESTRAAIAAGHIGEDLAGLDPARSRSLRMLHGRLMKALAEARPAVVVWDIYFPECEEAYDSDFIDGAQALQRAGTPVVVAVERTDVNGEPNLCPRIRAAVHSWGLIRMVRPREPGGELFFPLCTLRGFAPPIPSLATAAFAAARYHDSVAEYRPESACLEIRYRRRSAGTEQGSPAGSPQPLWRRESDRLPLAHVDLIRSDEVLHPEDQVLLARTVSGMHPTPVIAYEEVLLADADRRREWFAGRAVVVGQMVPGIDEFVLPDGSRAFGCQFHARALQSLLAGDYVARFSWFGLATRVVFWALAAAALAGLIARVPPRSLRRVGLTCLAVTLSGLTIAAAAADRVTTAWRIEVLIALAVLLAVGGPVYLAAAVRLRQLQLAPAWAWASGESTLSSTLLKETAGPVAPPGSRQPPEPQPGGLPGNHALQGSSPGPGAPASGSEPAREAPAD